MGKAFAAEKNLNDQFRAEFSSVLKFKLFTEEQLDKVDANVNTNA